MFEVSRRVDVPVTVSCFPCGRASVGSGRDWLLQLGFLASAWVSTLGESRTLRCIGTGCWHEAGWVIRLLKDPIWSNVYVLVCGQHLDELHTGNDYELGEIWQKELPTAHPAALGTLPKT